MRINELLTEDQLDELSLKGVGRGVGNVIRGTSSAINGVKGAWQGAKDAWAQGKQSGSYDTARSAISGTDQPPASNTTTANTSPQQSTQAAPTSTNQTQPADSQTPTNGGNEVDQILQMVSKLDPAAKKEIVSKIQSQSAATQTPTNPSDPNYSGGQTQGNVPKVNYSFKAPTKPTQSQTNPSAGQQEPEDDNPNIVKGNNEDVGFRSSFLGMDI